jgi:hypothetical protein
MCQALFERGSDAKRGEAVRPIRSANHLAACRLDPFRKLASQIL